MKTYERFTPAERRLLKAIHQSTIGNEPPIVAYCRRTIDTNAKYRERIDAFANSSPIPMAEEAVQ